MLRQKLSHDAGKFIEKLVPKHQKQIAAKILDLLRDPEPPDSQLLKNTDQSYRRADAGEYRIIYGVSDDNLEVFLIGKRNDPEVYRRFRRK
jgi:mRNA-degrading endonuclease RelE of RelBE toxin-antitoxin system